ncbi:phosphatase 2C [Salpingoeca rosetta]|uniref:Phosphatase 2C n=1 Tax=Salpingoeca rosetta (strain ATCC 50818 / BSB-021) TaxID=946362 RepID=F2UB45_SALR5|nr:phosphatase 2C [Salpingoeca rosetta]EGD74058.1 phosphatase 2C [Salpingoeca rosetta]|eukprot:XP_004993620.1 phosphatase 2C [Salpingoeca rosetta]
MDAWARSRAVPSPTTNTTYRRRRFQTPSPLLHSIPHGSQRRAVSPVPAVSPLPRGPPSISPSARKPPPQQQQQRARTPSSRPSSRFGLSADVPAWTSRPRSLSSSEQRSLGMAVQGTGRRAPSATPTLSPPSSSSTTAVLSGTPTPGDDVFESSRPPPSPSSSFSPHSWSVRSTKTSTTTTTTTTTPATAQPQPYPSHHHGSGTTAASLLDLTHHSPASAASTPSSRSSFGGDRTPLCRPTSPRSDAPRCSLNATTSAGTSSTTTTTTTTTAYGGVGSRSQQAATTPPTSPLKQFFDSPWSSANTRDGTATMRPTPRGPRQQRPPSGKKLLPLPPNAARSPKITRKATSPMQPWNRPAPIVLGPVNTQAGDGGEAGDGGGGETCEQSVHGKGECTTSKDGVDDDSDDDGGGGGGGDDKGAVHGGRERSSCSHEQDAATADANESGVDGNRTTTRTLRIHNRSVRMVRQKALRFNPDEDEDDDGDHDHDDVSGNSHTTTGSTGHARTNTTPGGAPDQQRQQQQQQQQQVTPSPPSDAKPRTRRPLRRQHSSPALIDSADEKTTAAKSPSASSTASSSSSSPSKPPRPLIGVCSMAGGIAGVAKENQDSYFVLENPTQASDFVVGVLDGHGVHGEKASGFVRKAFPARLLRRDITLTPSTALKDTVLETAKALDRAGFSVRESGTTAVTVLKHGKFLHIANVGDSRAVVGQRRSKGGTTTIAAVSLTRDHKPSDRAELLRVQRAGGVVEPSFVPGMGYQGPMRVWKKRQQLGGLALSRSIGDTALATAGVIPVPDVLQRELTSHDEVLVLGSDGVFDHLSNNQVVQIAARFGDPQRAAEAVVKEARRKWTEEGGGYIDDVTALVVMLNPSHQQMQQQQQSQQQQQRHQHHQQPRSPRSPRRGPLHGHHRHSHRQRRRKPTIPH